MLQTVCNTVLLLLTLTLQHDLAGALEGRGEATGSPAFLGPERRGPSSGG